jgi:Uma2 family endonuclease
MSTIALLSFAEFEQLPATELKQELLDGQVITLPPPKIQHSKLIRRLEDALQRLAGRDRVWIETGFRIGEQWVIPDVSIIHPAQKETGGYFSGAPEIAIEVASKGNTAEELDRKTQLYLQNGASEVWVVYPRTSTMVVYHPDGRITQIRDRYSCIDLNEIFQP